MVFLPILQREFQRASRRRQTYWMRMSAAMAGAGLGILTLLSSLTTPATTNRSLFALTSAISFWLSFLAIGTEPERQIPDRGIRVVDRAAIQYQDPAWH